MVTFLKWNNETCLLFLLLIPHASFACDLSIDPMF
jgi:hypothetical protein